MTSQPWEPGRVDAYMDQFLNPNTAYPDWESAYLDNVERLYRLMYSRVGNKPDAEDLTSEVFRAALGPMHLTVSKGEVRAYLLTTARTVLASHWRRRFGVEITEIDPETDIRFFRGDVPEGDSSLRAQQILELLPDRYRRILELRFLEGCSIKESAKAMGINAGNAKVLQHRALREAARLSAELNP